MFSLLLLKLQEELPTQKSVVKDFIDLTESSRSVIKKEDKKNKKNLWRKT